MNRSLFKALVALIALLTFGVALADKSHVVKATVVAIDNTAHTLTLQGPDGKTSTAPVEGDALKALGSLKAGEDVSVTCRDNDQGEHQAVSAVKVVKKSGY